jgi:hypothetical protein
VNTSMLGKPVPFGAPIYAAPSGLTGVAYVGPGWQRVARFGGPDLRVGWRLVGVYGEPPRSHERSLPMPPHELHDQPGALSAMQAAVEADMPRRREEWAEACADVRMGWDGDEP